MFVNAAKGQLINTINFRDKRRCNTLLKLSRVKVVIIERVDGKDKELRDVPLSGP